MKFLGGEKILRVPVREGSEGMKALKVPVGEDTGGEKILRVPAGDISGRRDCPEDVCR